MKNTVRGFTLIEMLVVIAIIAILSGIIITNLSGARGKARDAQRISDMGNLQMALELYFDRCNAYPANVNGTGIGPIDIGRDASAHPCTRTNSNTGQPYRMSDFIASIPVPPSGAGQNYYEYTYHWDSANQRPPYEYVLRAKLEYPNATVKGISLPGWFTESSLPTSYPNFTCDKPTGQPTDYCLGPK